jgi:Domain of unknown function (DUF3644)
MKREAHLLLDKACDSLILSIEFFNRPHDIGRTTSTLILLDHAFEMLLKASILQKGGKIREKRAHETIGFDKCIRRALSDVRFINEEQALTLQSINNLRDAAQHHLLDISENQLYMHAQSGLTLFRDILNAVFNRDLKQMLPERVLPISTIAPINLEVLFDNEIAEILKLLQPHSRKQLEAQTRLRPLMILDSSLKGEKRQPAPSELAKLGCQLVDGKRWQDIFPSVASMDLTATGEGTNLSIRWTKKEGIPIHVVPEGTPGASVVAVKRVNELDYYCLSIRQLAENVKLSSPKTGAVIRSLNLEGDLDCFKEIQVGKVRFKRYSQKAIPKIEEAIKTGSVDDIWMKYRPKRRKEANAPQT